MYNDGTIECYINNKLIIKGNDRSILYGYFGFYSSFANQSNIKSNSINIIAIPYNVIFEPEPKVN